MSMCVRARAHATTPEVDARQYALTMCLPAYVREYGEKYVARIYATKYVQYVTYIAPGYQLFTKLIWPLNELLIATKLHVQFFFLTDLPMISAFFFFFNSMNWDRPIC